MLISAKFSYHLNKTYSITAHAASSKLTVEEGRGLFPSDMSCREKGIQMALIVSHSNGL